MAGVANSLYMAGRSTARRALECVARALQREHHFNIEGK